MTRLRTLLSIIAPMLMLCCTVVSLQAAEAEVGFSWLSNDEPTLSGYKIHYGTTSQNYTFVIDVGLPEIVEGRVKTKIGALQEGQVYYFAATAYDDSGESGFSTEVEHMVPFIPRIISISQKKL
jgi:hypothetical protein